MERSDEENEKKDKLRNIKRKQPKENIRKGRGE